MNNDAENSHHLIQKTNTFLLKWAKCIHQAISIKKSKNFLFWIFKCYNSLREQSKVFYKTIK